MKTFKSPKEIKVGVIGYGSAFNMGKAHLEQMQQAGMSPVAIAERDSERLTTAEIDFPGIHTFTSVTQMLKKSDVNLIVIITPHNTHAKLAIQCLNAGRHVVCEKPLAITTAEVDTMITTAKRRRVMLSTYHNRHWDGCILEAIRRIKEKGEIGDIVRIDAHGCLYEKPGDWWRSSKSISGGILYDWGVHLLEYSLQLIDSDITEVSGFAHNGFWASQTPWKKDTNEDDALAVVRFKSGQWLTLHFSQVDTKGKEGQMHITGTKGTYQFDYDRFKIHKSSPKQNSVTERPHPEGLQHLYYENIAAYLTGKADLIITPEWSRRPIHILDLAHQSAKQGKALKVKYK